MSFYLRLLRERNSDVIMMNVVVRTAAKLKPDT